MEMVVKMTEAVVRLRVESQSRVPSGYFIRSSVRGSNQARDRKWMGVMEITKFEEVQNIFDRSGANGWLEIQSKQSKGLQLGNMKMLMFLGETLFFSLSSVTELTQCELHPSLQQFPFEGCLSWHDGVPGGKRRRENSSHVKKRLPVRRDFTYCEMQTTQTTDSIQFNAQIVNPNRPSQSRLQNLTPPPVPYLCTAAHLKGSVDLHTWKQQTEVRLFVGVSLERNIVTTRTDTNLQFYGDPYLTTADILPGTVDRPKAAEPLYATLRDLHCKLQR